MLISCMGHAKFLIELDSGYRIVTDPFDASVGYPMQSVKTDAVFVSHQHHDHNALNTLADYTTVVDAAGKRTLVPDVTVEAIACWHDEVQGAKRGSNLMFVLQAEGLKVAHLGDLGHIPTAEQLEKLQGTDILMIPVGGFFTIDAETAKQVCDLVQPKVIMPMHYRTAVNAEWPIAPVDNFLQYYPENEKLRILRVEKEDIHLQPKVAVLTAE